MHEELIHAATLHSSQSNKGNLHEKEHHRRRGHADHAACVRLRRDSGQETVGAYIDDAAITSSIKTRFFDNKQVDASSIRVETLNGVVQLSGFAKNAMEKSTAESIASDVKGVKSVRNEIAVHP